jgi:hypothetical protein
MQRKVRAFGNNTTRKDSIKLRFGEKVREQWRKAEWCGLDGQTLAAFGAAGVDDSAAATGFHTDQKAVGTRAAGLGGLVSAFHGSTLNL